MGHGSDVVRSRPTIARPPRKHRCLFYGSSSKSPGSNPPCHCSIASSVASRSSCRAHRVSPCSRRTSYNPSHWHSSRPQKCGTAEIQITRYRGTNLSSIRQNSLTYFFAPSSADLSDAAITAPIRAPRNPDFSRAWIPAIVVPPGLVTLSRRLLGCSPVWRTISAVPRTV